jgi:hypothetical protein
MWIVAVAWTYVVLMMALAEATAPQGSVLGAVSILLFYGVLPLGVLLYIMATPARKRARRRAEAEAEAASAAQPDGGGQAAGDAVAPVREEP